MVISVSPTASSHANARKYEITNTYLYTRTGYFESAFLMNLTRLTADNPSAFICFPNLTSGYNFGNTQPFSFIYLLFVFHTMSYMHCQ